MPELPEVETTRRGLAPFLVNQRIRTAVVSNAALRLRQELAGEHDASAHDREHDRIAIGEPLRNLTSDPRNFVDDAPRGTDLFGRLEYAPGLLWSGFQTLWFTLCLE